MKHAILYPVVFAAGVLATIAVPFSDERAASAISQAIYDCGIRIADGASEGTVSGFRISGHRFGICLDGGHGLTLSDNTIATTGGLGLNIAHQ